MGFRVNLEAGEFIRVGDVRVELVHKSGRRAALLVTAPDDMPITGRKDAIPARPPAVADPEKA